MSIPLSFNKAFVKYNRPYPVACVRASDPPYERPLPVSTPSKDPRILLYCPNMKPISLAPVPISPAGTSTSAPIYLESSVMKLWQNAMISLSDLPLGSKSEPPLPPPIGSVVREFLKICSKPKNLIIPKFTEG